MPRFEAMALQAPPSQRVKLQNALNWFERVEGFFGQYPELTHYYGLTPTEIFGMGEPLRRLYLKNLARIKAESVRLQAMAMQLAFSTPESQARQQIEGILTQWDQTPPQVIPKELWEAQMAAMGMAVRRD